MFNCIVCKYSSNVYCYTCKRAKEAYELGKKHSSLNKDNSVSLKYEYEKKAYSLGLNQSKVFKPTLSF